MMENTKITTEKRRQSVLQLKCNNKKLAKTSHGDTPQVYYQRLPYNLILALKLEEKEENYPYA